MSVSGPSRVYLFGDQTFNYEQSLTRLLRSDNKLLVTFFSACYEAIRTELGRLPPHARDTTPKFSSITDLVSRKRDDTLSPALDGVLSLIHNLAAFIWRHADGNLTYPTAQDSRLFGLCTGALAAAAVSSSQDLIQLIPAAVHATVVALHTGLRAEHEALATRENNSASRWSMVVQGVSKDELTRILDLFNIRKPVPTSSYAYISSISTSTSTVSGPPDVLKELSQTSNLSKVQKAFLPIRSPYHAPHLFSSGDVDIIIQNSESWATPRSSSSIPVLSSGTGHLVWVASSQAMMDSAVHDMLTRPLLADKAIEALSTGFNNGTSGQVLIVPVGTEIGESVKRRFESAMVDSKDTSVSIAPQIEVPEPIRVMGRSKIAVIGMSGRFPGASSADELWDLLQKGTDMCREVPELRWDVNTHVDPTGKTKNTNKVRWGCWLDDPDLFDAQFFAISPREAPQIDPAQRLALMTAYEAIEQAGVVPDRTPSTRADRVGVFYGVTSNDWCEANSGQDIDTYYIPGANRAFIPGRINYFFKFSGPSYAVDTACSSSLSAIHIACNSLWQGDIDMAIAGGTNVLTNPDMTTGLDKGHFLSATGNCKTFDESADGYCRGEGVATVILKRLEDALEDADPIFGVITSAYTNHSAEAESITRPHVGAQKDIFERVLSNSGTNPYEVGYIEMHGTGTQAGDLREMTSVCDTFAPNDKPHSRPADQPLHLGALKANIGHGESVSGVSALIKTMLMMRKGEITPHCGIKTRINPKFPLDLAQRNVHIDLKSTKWPRTRGLPRKAIINNFSAAGGNTCLLIEEALPRAVITAEQGAVRPLFPVTISARCAKSLEANIQALLRSLSSSNVDLPALSYTTTARRIHHQFRVTVTVENLDQLKTNLAQGFKDGLGAKRIIPPRQMLFAFTGQGSQYPGMGKQLLESLGVFRDQIIHFDELAQRLGLPGFISLLHASRGGDIAAYPPVVVQLANTCMQIALARIWISWGITPTAVLGHSLGEYAALNIAGVLSDADTVYLVGRRAQLLQELCDPGSHAMLAVAASVEDLKASIHGANFEFACLNGPKETVLAGPKTQVLEWKKTLTAGGVRNTLLQVPYAFHSSQIGPIRAAFGSAAEGVVFRKPEIPVLSPLLGSVVQDSGVFNSEYVVRHAREPVKMMESLQSAFTQGILTEKSFGIEFGPHPVVSGMIKATLGPGITVLPTLRNKSKPWTILTQSLSTIHQAGVRIKWDGYFTDIPSAKRVVELPSYKWELQSFWIKYRNDWTLTKGDIPIKDAKAQVAIGASPAARTEKPIQPAAAPLPKLESSSIHKVLKEEITAQGFSIEIESDTAGEDLKPFISGHTVDGYSLCTPAVYADIAFTLGRYVLDRVQPPFPENITTVNGLDIKRALIGSADWKQILRCSASFQWASKGGDVSFSVHDENGNEVGILATCQVRFVDDSDLRRLKSDLPAFKADFDRMRAGCAEGKVSRFGGNMSYRLVSALAEFNPDYHCIDEVLFDSDGYEAACTVSFGQMKQGGNFFINPGMVDGLTQSAGFTMNANDRTQLQTDVFVNHGWKEFQLYEKIQNDRQYRTHVRMTDTGAENLWSGDISVFSGDVPVALVKGVQIQGVQRRYLRYILSNAAKPPKSLRTNGSAPAARPAQPAASKAPAPAKPAAVRAQPPPPAAAAPVQAPLPTANTAPQTASPADNDQVTKALEIISAESGVPMSDFRDDTLFEDLGIDSLLSLMITSQFSEEMGINAEPTFFMENRTVADVKRFFDASVSNTEQPALQPAPVAQAPEQTYVQPEALAPAQTLSAQNLDTVPVEGDTFGNGTFETVLKVISEETEIPLGQLDNNDASLPDLGVDSLLALMIGSRLRDEFDIELDTHALLTTLNTIGQLREFLGANHNSSSDDTSSDRSSAVMVEASGPTTPASDFEEVASAEEVPPTTSVVLQGNSRTSSEVLWFFPDGSGLASSYIEMPRIRDNLVVYGMNSPYLKKGLEMNCSWDAMVGSYINEIRRRQPHGPYSFAGWSAGGILAYRASQLLMAGGEIVRDLIILDSPPPFNLKLLPEHFFDFASSSGLLGGNGKAPDWLINHFRNINKVLYTYSATPLTVSTLRKVNILWASESSVDDSFYKKSDDPEDMNFLTIKRTDYSAGKWGPLFPQVPIKVDLATGQHHWSLLKGASAVRVAAYIRDILA